MLFQPLTLQLRLVVIDRDRRCLSLLAEVVDWCASRVGKADLLAYHFERKQSRESVDLTPTCHPPAGLITFAFSPSEVRRILLDLVPYGGTDPLSMFPLFLRELLMFWPRVSV